MPRIFRQSPLNSIWEGSGNVQVVYREEGLGVGLGWGGAGQTETD